MIIQKSTEDSYCLIIFSKFKHLYALSKKDEVDKKLDQAINGLSSQKPVRIDEVD